jgi:hypothetical protein
VSLDIGKNNLYASYSGELKTKIVKMTNKPSTDSTSIASKHLVTLSVYFFTISLLIVGYFTIDKYERVTITDRVHTPEQRHSAKIPNLIEIENLVVLSKSSSIDINRQPTHSFTADTWSLGHHLLFHNKQKNQQIVYQLPSTKGLYRIQARFTKASDYGILRISINGKQAREIDLYSEKIESTGIIDLGNHELSGNLDRFELEIVGHNQHAKRPYYQFGVDGVVLSKSNSK